MNNGNKNTRIFIGLIIVVLFVFGFIKSMMNTQTKQTIETNHLVVEINNTWTLVSQNNSEDTICLKDSSGEAEITYGISSQEEKDKADTINEYSVYSTTLEMSDGYCLQVSLVNDDGEVAMLSYQSKQNITYKNTKIQKLLKNITIK